MIQFPDSKYLTENDTFRYMVNKSKKKAYHIWEKLRILYSEPHRFYHTGRHVQHLIDLINAEKNLRKDQQEILYIVSFFHDAIYNPSKSYNEEASCDLFCGMLKKTNRFLTCIKMIEDTKTHQPRSKLSKLFCEFDLWTLIHGTFLDLLENERLIFKEYQFCSYYKYKQSRHDFLSKIKLHPMVTKNSENINTLMF